MGRTAAGLPRYDRASDWLHVGTRILPSVCCHRVGPVELVHVSRGWLATLCQSLLHEGVRCFALADAAWLQSIDDIRALARGT